MITVQLLGGACLRSDDVPVGGPPAQRHRLALLALVVGAWPRPLSRDRAMALLWPEKDTAAARRLLNLAVHVLRGALGEDAILSTGDGLLLNPAHVPCDLHELRAAIAAGDVERVASGWAGPLLDGFHLDESPEFGYWLDAQRAELGYAYADALRTLAARQEDAGDVHGRVATCRRLVAADPLSGAHALALMRALDAAGDRASAIQHAADHARRLRAELDLGPDAEVSALAERLRAAPASPPAPVSTPAAALGWTASIAVLPFLDRGADAEQACFADGITEDVIAHLARIRSLKVISRASVMAYRDRRPSPREIGAALGARTLLDGSVRRAGDRVRIVASLVDVEDDRHLWAETYDRQLTDIFDIQTDVALKIASALESELTREERARVQRAPTHDLQAWQLYLQGRRWLILYDGESYVRALHYFERALARDATFALAAASIAMACAEGVEAGELRAHEAHPRAAAAAATALRIDPELAEAHCADAWLHVTRDFDWRRAEQGFRRALELSPGSADAYDLYGRMLTAVERWDEAIAMTARARELDPGAHRVDVASALLRAGRVAEATALCEELLELEPAHARCLATLGWAYLLGGRAREAVRQLERAVAVAPASTVWLAQLGQAYGMTGDPGRAHEVLRRLEELAQARFVSPYHFAYVYTGLGEADRAVDQLERAFAERTGAIYGIRGSFLLASLKEHPRFRMLLRRMNLA